jgi:hypothetical protein
MLKLLLALAVLGVLSGAAAWADPQKYDGLTFLGESRHYPVDGGGSLTLMALRTKYKEPLVGFYFKQGTQEVRFYANAATWDRLEQMFIKTRDHWDTIDDAAFKSFGTVTSYRIANRQAVMRLGIQGATALSPKMLFMYCMGGPSEIRRATVHFSQGTLRSLVEDLYKIDDLERKFGAPPQ